MVAIGTHQRRREKPQLSHKTTERSSLLAQYTFYSPYPTKGGDPKEKIMTSDKRHVHFEDEVLPPPSNSRRSRDKNAFPIN